MPLRADQRAAASLGGQAGRRRCVLRVNEASRAPRLSLHKHCGQAMVRRRARILRSIWPALPALVVMSERADVVLHVSCPAQHPSRARASAPLLLMMMGWSAEKSAAAATTSVACAGLRARAPPPARPQRRRARATLDSSSAQRKAWTGAQRAAARRPTALRKPIVRPVTRCPRTLLGVKRALEALMMMPTRRLPSRPSTLGLDGEGQSLWPILSP